MQFLQNFLFAIGFALSDGALARYLNGAFGVLTALALGALTRRHLGEQSGPAAAALFFTLPITWSMMTHARGAPRLDGDRAARRRAPRGARGGPRGGEQGDGPPRAGADGWRARVPAPPPRAAVAAGRHAGRRVR